MIRSNRRLKLCGVLTACCLVFIWGNSLMPGSVSQLFSDCVQGLLGTLFSGGGEAGASGGSGLLRKVAHFTEFAALGMCLGWLFGMLEKRPAWPFALGVAAACLDETIQFFVPGRSPGVPDVCIDSCGAAFGMFLLYLGHSYFKKKRTNHSGGN